MNNQVSEVGDEGVVSSPGGRAGSSSVCPEVSEVWPPHISPRETTSPSSARDKLHTTNNLIIIIHTYTKYISTMWINRVLNCVLIWLADLKEATDTPWLNYLFKLNKKHWHNND